MSLGTGEYAALQHLPSVTLGALAVAEALNVDPATVLRLIDEGVLVADLGFDPADTGGSLDALTRALWQGLPHDLSCLAVLAELEQVQVAIVACRSAHPPTRREGLRQLAGARSRIVPCRPGARTHRPVVHEDAFEAVDPAEFPDCGAFLADIGRYGTPTGCLSLPSRMLAAIHDELAPDGQVIGMLAFHRHFLGVCQANGVEPDPYASASILLQRLGRHEPDPSAAVATDLLGSMQGGRDQVRLDLPFEHPPSATARMALRFRSAGAGSGDGRFQLLFWGADQMSLMPRYCLSQASRAGFAAWMARWPEVADIHSACGRTVDVRPRSTARVIQAPNERLRPGAIPLRDLIVARTTSGLSLLDRDGRELRPAFLGVSSWSHMPEMVRFMTALPARFASPLELAVAGLGRCMSQVLTEPPAKPTRLPAVLLGNHVVLHQPSLVFDPTGLPGTDRPVSRRSFFAVQDWLLDHGLSPLLEVHSRSGSIVVDLRNPFGIESLHRFARSEPALIAHSLVPGNGDGRVTEYYVEMAV